MTALLFLLVLAVVGGISWSASRAQARSLDHEWRAVARALGLQFSSTQWSTAVRSLTGKMNGVSVRCEDKSAGKTRHTFFSAAGAMNPRIRISGESMFPVSLLAPQDVQIGDAHFDKAVNVRGPEALLLALLNPQNRALISNLVASGGEIVDGQVRLRLNRQARGPELSRWLRMISDIAQNLSLSSEEIAGALRERTRSEPLADARFRCLKGLIQHFPEAKSTAEICAERLKDPDARIRLCAARVAPLRLATPALADLVGDPSSLQGLRIDALNYLGLHLPFRELRPVLEDALGVSDGSLKTAAIRLAGKYADPVLLPSLLQLIGRSSAEVEEAVAEALGKFTGDKVEDALLDLLERESVAIRRAAATSLRTAGTVRAVEPLLEQTTGVLTDRGLKDAARDAVRAIQNRLGHVEAGRISLIEDSEKTGALSVAENVGAVALADTRRSKA